MIRTILWDVGGVLLRTEDKTPRTQLAKKFGLTYNELDRIVFGDDDQHRAQKGEISETTHYKNIAAALQISESEIFEFKRQFFAGDQIDHKLIAWVNSFRGRYQMAILSNAMSGLRHTLVTKYDIARYFDPIFVSAEMHQIKPEKRIFELVCQVLHQEPHEIVFIDDNLDNVRAAESLNMFSILFRDRNQTIIELEELLSII